jgi:hypothetical protein
LTSINQGKLEQINFESLARELLEPNKCYLLDCGAEIYVWMGRSASLQERKGASKIAEVFCINYLCFFIVYFLKEFFFIISILRYYSRQKIFKIVVLSNIRKASYFTLKMERGNQFYWAHY